MKRALTMLLALVLLGALAACGQTPRPAEEDPLTLLRQEIADSGSQLGVAFLGVMKDTDGDMAAWLADSGWTQTFPFLTALTAEQTVSQPGNEVYCIVPADESACLTVRAYDPLNETSPVGEVLYESADGTPVCLRGNVSDIMPNMEVTVSGEGGETVYQPALSLMDGAVSIIAGKGSVYDFTPGASHDAPQIRELYSEDFSYTDGVGNTGRYTYRVPQTAGGHGGRGGHQPRHRRGIHPHHPGYTGVHVRRLQYDLPVHRVGDVPVRRHSVAGDLLRLGCRHEQL